MTTDLDLTAVFNKSPQDAINFLVKKGYKLSWDWWDVWQEAHAKAFTVAKVARLDILQDIDGALTKAADKGLTFATFQKELMPTLQKKGWWGHDLTEDGKIVTLGTPYRLENIYRTNIQSAYMAGRYKQQMENARFRPYFQYQSIIDSRTRPAHSALNGKVFRYDDPFWDTHYPLQGFRCRCRVRALTEKQVKDKGLEVETGNGNMVWEEKKINAKGDTMPVCGYKDPKTGKITFTDPGFSSNPGKTSFKIDPSKYGKDLRKFIPEPAPPLPEPKPAKKPKAPPKPKAEKPPKEPKPKKDKAPAAPLPPKSVADAKKVKDLKSLKQWAEYHLGKFCQNSNGYINFTYRKMDAFMATNTVGKFYVCPNTISFMTDLGAVSFNPADELLGAFKAAGKNIPLTFQQEYSVESLWHEVLHNRQKFVRIGAGRITDAERPMMETVNQWYARRSYQELLAQMGATPVNQAKILTDGYGYGSYLKRFGQVLEAFEVEDTAIFKSIEAIHSTINPKEYAEHVAEAILTTSKTVVYSEQQKRALVTALNSVAEYSSTFYNNLRDCLLLIKRP